jgi:gas vesicle protein
MSGGDDRDARVLAALDQLRDDLAGQLMRVRADVMEKIDRLQDVMVRQIQRLQSELRQLKGEH